MTSTKRIDATTTSQLQEATITSADGSRPPTAPIPLPGATKHSAFDWRKRYARNLWLTDLLVLIWVVCGTQIVWLGFGDVPLSTDNFFGLSNVSYWLFSAALIILWTWSLGLIDSRSHRVIGTGTTEYVRVTRASFSLFGAIAIVAFLTRIDIARGYLLISLPIGVILLVYVRWLWRQWLVSNRRVGTYSARALFGRFRDRDRQYRP